MSAPALTFRDVVRLLKAISSRSSANPILSHVLAEPCALDGSPSQSVVRLTMTDTAIYARIVLPLPAGSALSGPVAIPAGTLAAAIARRHGMPPLSGPSQSGPALSVLLDGATVPAPDAADFPALPAGPDTDIPTDPSWIAAAAAVLPAVSDDDTRTGLNGVHVESCGLKLRLAAAAGLRLVATDGHRLHIATAPGSLPGLGDAGALLSRPWVKLAATLPVLTCAVDAGAAVARGADFVLGATSPGGDFPDFRQVVPGEGSQGRSLTVATADLASALKRALDIVGKSGGCPVALHCGEADTAPAIRMAAKDCERGALDLTIEASYAGEPLTIGLNARYALDAIAFCDGDAVQFGIGDALSPVLVASARTDRLAVVMPQRIE